MKSDSSSASAMRFCRLRRQPVKSWWVVLGLQTLRIMTNNRCLAGLPILAPKAPKVRFPGINKYTSTPLKT